LNEDFLDMLSALSEEGVRFLVVGAYALAHHGLPRATGDLDLWVERTAANPANVLRALQRFGAPLGEVSADDFAEPDLVFQIGVAPCRIDLMTSIDGVSFEDAWGERVELELEGVPVPILSKRHLIANKRAVGRPQDLADLAWLESEATEPA